MPGEYDSFALSFIHSKLRKECKEDYLKVGGSKAGIRLQTVKIMCSLEGGHPLEGGI